MFVVFTFNRHNRTEQEMKQIYWIPQWIRSFAQSTIGCNYRPHLQVKTENLMTSPAYPLPNQLKRGPLIIIIFLWQVCGFRKSWKPQKWQSPPRADEWFSVSLSVGCHHSGAYGVDSQRAWSTTNQKITLVRIYLAWKWIKCQVLKSRKSSDFFCDGSVWQLISVMWESILACFTALMTMSHLL